MSQNCHRIGFVSTGLPQTLSGSTSPFPANWDYPVVPGAPSEMDTNDLQSLGLEPLIDVKDLALYLGVPVSTIYDWRVSGKGPRAYRFGRHLKFAVSDVKEWVQTQRHSDASFGEVSGDES